MTNQYYSDKEDIGHGGFLLNNIRNWIIKECLESGDPENFFECIWNVMTDLVDNVDEDGWNWDDFNE